MFQPLSICLPHGLLYLHFSCGGNYGGRGRFYGWQCRVCCSNVVTCLVSVYNRDSRQKCVVRMCVIADSFVRSPGPDGPVALFRFCQNGCIFYVEPYIRLCTWYLTGATVEGVPPFSLITASTSLRRVVSESSARLEALLST